MHSTLSEQVGAACSGGWVVLSASVVMPTVSVTCGAHRSDLRLNAKPSVVTLRQSPVAKTTRAHGGNVFMGSNVRDLIGFDHGAGKLAVIAGLAAAFVSTGTATAANMTPPPNPAVSVSPTTSESHRIGFQPRTGGGRDAVQLGPSRTTAAGRLIPRRPLLGHLIVQ